MNIFLCIDIYFKHDQSNTSKQAMNRVTYYHPDQKGAGKYETSCPHARGFRMPQKKVLGINE